MKKLKRNISNWFSAAEALSEKRAGKKIHGQV
jgi:hypothetical protein